MTEHAAAVTDVPAGKQQKKVVKIVIEARVREVLDGTVPLKVSPAFIEALNREVERLIGCAVERASQNGRVTLMAQDV